ncbi:MAG: acireductone synthase [Candidatus Acidiferrales bacterium]
MAGLPDEIKVRVLLLDIEGTITPIDFFSGTLFPYARQRWEEFLLLHGRELGIRDDLDGLRRQHAADAAAKLEPPPWLAGSPDANLSSAITYGTWLMDHDSKCTALKSLQGKIWREGYQKGELRGEVYPDVPPAFARWSQQGTRICIFSSGSVIAQRPLFATTTAGNLTRFIHANFDTTMGTQSEPQSYRRIAGSLTLPPRQILFISEVVEELDAALHAGMHTALCLRTQISEESEENHWVIRSFDDVFPCP